MQGGSMLSSQLKAQDKLVGFIDLVIGAANKHQQPLKVVEMLEEEAFRVEEGQVESMQFDGESED